MFKTINLGQILSIQYMSDRSTRGVGREGVPHLFVCMCVYVRVLFSSQNKA